MKEISIRLSNSFENKKEQLLNQYFENKEVNSKKGQWFFEDGRQDFYYNEKWIFSIWINTNLDIEYTWNN